MQAAPDLSEELDPHATPIPIHPSDSHGSLRKGMDDNDANCWSSPSGKGFMIRGKNYLKDNSKVNWPFKLFGYKEKECKLFWTWC